MSSLIAPITPTEVIGKVFTAGNNSAPGADGIPYEVLKAMPDCFFKWLTTVFNIVIDNGICPPEWKEGDVFIEGNIVFDPYWSWQNEAHNTENGAEAGGPERPSDLHPV